MQEYSDALNRQQSKQLAKFQQWQQEQIQQQQEKIQKQQEEIEQRHQIQVIQKQQNELQQKQEEKFVNYYASDITQIYAERHWSEHLVNDDSVFLFVLSAQGDILYCSETCQGLTGYSANDVVGHAISEFLHPDDQHNFRSLLDRIFEAPLQLSKIQFRWKKKNSTAEFICLQCIGHSKPDDIPTYTLMPSSNQIESNYYAFFAIAQIREPTTADVLAQLKKENQRLQQQLTQYANAAATTLPSASSSSSVIASWMQSGLSTHPWPPPQNIPAAPVQQHVIKNDPLLASTQFHQDDSLSRRTTLNGNTNNTIHEEKTKKKKKVYVTMEEHHCLDCGSTNSPEWRKGPLGRKTLCNACGLRWAKKNKKVNLDG
ncbi:hypothetical protein BCR42DRAFT_412756 [Absidia repens]|uniref:Uncharacterized protein n=1 Tax=Absidia repens TaxID=90262 RepID=A0A1X2IK66_9FUNG|nr:hypothetical protein BCR42DRAFT_412756 [Absidia repens]